jgi:hypothetical protein
MSTYVETREENRRYLPPAAQARIAACGQPMRLLRQSGDVEWVPFRCEHRFCTECARRYSWRVAQALRQTFEDTDVYMLTVTQRLPEGHTAEDLERNWEIIRQHWDRATEQARHHCEGVRKRKAHEAKEAHATTAADRATARHWREYWDEALQTNPPEDAPEHVGSAALPYLGTKWSRTWVPSRGEYDAPDELTYMWVREVTRGDAGQWHVHAHVICPDRATAEILNAAWQDTRQRQSEPCKTDIKGPDDVREQLRDAEGGDDVGDLAEYVTKYVTGARDGAFTDEWSTAERCAYVRGMADKRVYDAAGDWRPIGIRHEADPEDPAVAVAWSDYDQWEDWSTFWSEDSRVREVMSTAASHGRSCVPSEVMAGMATDVPWLTAVRKRILEQHRNISETPPDGLDLDTLEQCPADVLRGRSPPVATETEAPCGC